MRFLFRTGVTGVLCVALCVMLGAGVLWRAGEVAAQEADEASATAFVTELGNRAIVMLGDADVSESEREQTFAVLLNENFDLEAITRFVLARYARTATAEQLALFEEGFGYALARQFVPLFARYDGPPLQATDFVADSKHEQIGSVSVAIETASGAEALTEWRLIRKPSGDYKVLDVKIEGVSMSLTVREEFNAILSRVGIEGLIAELRRRSGR